MFFSIEKKEKENFNFFFFAGLWTKLFFLPLCFQVVGLVYVSGRNKMGLRVEVLYS